MSKLSAATALAVVGLLVPAAAASADKPVKVKPAKQCTVEKRADREAFREAYGKRAMRTCIKGVKQEARNAAKRCKQQRADDRDAFRDRWGTGPKGRNALGKCVSATVKDETDGAEEKGKNGRRGKQGKAKGHGKNCEAAATPRERCRGKRRGHGKR